MNTANTVVICLYEKESDKLRKALTQARASSTTALCQAFTAKINPELVELAQARVCNMKRKMQMALAASKRTTQMNTCCDESAEFDTLKSEIVAFVQLMERNMRRLYKAAETGLEKAKATIAIAAFERAVVIVLQNQRREA